MNNDEESDDLRLLEYRLLTNFQQPADLPATPEVRGISSGRYGETLDEHFRSVNGALSSVGESLRDEARRRLETPDVSELDWFLAAVCSLLHFVRCNWTGPEDAEDVVLLAPFRAEALRELTPDDQCNDNLVKPELLYFAKIVFSSERIAARFASCDWWALRANFLHELVLDGSSDVLLERSEALVERIRDSGVARRDPLLRTLFAVELSRFYSRYKRIRRSERYLNEALAAAGLGLGLEGALGKRTKFQKEAKPQLCASVAKTGDAFPSRNCPDLPKPLELNDELRLERIEFLEAKERPEIGALEECVILAKCFHSLLSQPKDRLTDEEIIPYLNNVIEYTKNWPLLMSALHQRCTMELRDRRTVERAMAQAENLMELLNHAVPPTSNRMDFFFAAGMKPIWTYKQILADAMLSLGLVKGALDIYLKLGLWEDVIVCYTLLQLRHKAAEIIRQEIGKKPTVKLWCLLGDATDETEHYETAWKLSNERSSRAQRHWGFYYFSRNNYREAIPHLELSARLNNIQENVWIRLGYAALQVEDWKLAATAYKRYCSLEQTTFEAWNNLAKAYVKMGEKDKAWRSLQDAIKCNYDRWEIWDNLMLVSLDLGHFSEVIRCYHRILDLKGKHADVQVLGILASVVRENRADNDGNPSRRLLPKTLELFGRLAALVINDSEVWRLYAELTLLNGTELDAQKAAQYLQRSYRAAISDSGWARSVEGTERVLDLCIQLGRAYLRCQGNLNPAQRRSMLGSAKLCLRSVLSRIENSQASLGEALGRRVDTLDQLFDEIRREFDKARLDE